MALLTKAITGSEYALLRRNICHKQFACEVVLRKTSAHDYDFCEALFIDAHEAPLQQAGWDASQRLAYLQPQFARRERGIRHDCQQTNDMIIQCNGVDCGRLLVDYQDVDWQLIDIELCSEWCGRGINDFILSQLCADADEAGRLIAARVAFDNPLLGQLRRLDFEVCELGRVYLRLQRQPRSQ